MLSFSISVCLKKLIGIICVKSCNFIICNKKKLMMINVLIVNLTFLMGW